MLARGSHRFSAATGPQQAPQPGPSPDPTADDPLNPQVRLVLPAEKAFHARLYGALVAERRLVHESTYQRGSPAQADKWDTALYPRSPTDMRQETYDRGISMGLSEARLFRPNWSRDRYPIEMQVDHIVELQVTPRAERGLWNSAVNYELLDQPTNGRSGPRLRGNIARERRRLVALTGNAAWATLPLRFTVLIVEGSPMGERWQDDEIRLGEHLDIFDKL